MLTLDKVYHAAFVLKDVARKTDLIEAPKLSKDCQLYLKTENLQATGSFKVRGAYYKISQLSPEESAKGVIACSAGNHAQGVALAATRRGIKSIVCMPDGAPIMKVENTKNLGAEVCLVPGTYDDAHDKAVELQEETGMTFIHPYDDELVIAGQGTIGLEILDQLPDLDAVIVPVGGGGLISGVAFAIKSLRPEVKVYGVQAEGAPSMYRSLHEHKYQTLKAASTFADGIQVKTPGELTYQICEQYVDDIVTVTEDETAAAILSLMENQKLVAEGAGAVPVQTWYLHRCGLPLGPGVGLMTLEYVFHKTTVLLYATVMLLLQHKWLAANTSGVLNYLPMAYAVVAAILVVLVLVCVSPLIQNLARWLMQFLPKTEKWQQRRADWQQQLDILGEESRRLLADKPRCAKIFALQAVKLFGLFCLPYLCIRFMGLSPLSFAQVQLLTSLMLFLSNALPNVAGMGSIETAFLLVFGSFLERGEVMSVLMLYRIASYYVVFAASAVGFFFAQRHLAEMEPPKEA